MKNTTDRLIFNLVSYIFIGVFALLCLIPFIMVVSSSFTSEAYILKNGYSFIPGSLSLEGYKIAFQSPVSILRAYGITILVTATGTSAAVFLMSMTAYALQRRDFRMANGLSFYFFFTTLFSGGLVPWYILMVKYLHMRDNLLALILPYLFSVYYMLVMKGFMRGIPEALGESAKIDGANDFTIFLRIILPIAKPAVATVTLFVALNYWNDWFMCMLFVQDQKLSSLQYFLYTLITSADAIRNFVLSQNQSASVELIVPTESLKMAMTVIVTGPILLLYPFIQKYFVKGLTLGAVKG